MDIESLKCFLAVVEEKNITRAAKRLFITQQALSGIIQRLENECQATLLERKPTLRLTAAGEVVHMYALDVIKCSNSLQNALADIDKNCRTTLHFGISDFRSRAFFPQIWKQFHLKHPNVSVSLHNGRTESFYKDLQTGKINLFLGINAPSLAKIICKPLAEEWVVCIVTRTFMKEHFPAIGIGELKELAANGIDPDMLSGLPCIRQRADSGRGLLGIEHVLYNSIIETDRQTTTYQMVMEGNCFGFISPCFLYNHGIPMNREDGELWVLPLKKKTKPLTTSLVYNDGIHPVYMSDFIEITENVLADFNQYSHEMSLIK